MSPSLTRVQSLMRVPLDWTLEPERVALLVRDDDRPFALIGRWAEGGALIGSEPVRVARPDEDPFTLLDQQPSIVPPLGSTGAVGGGWFGWLGYDLGRRLETLNTPPPSAPPRAPAFNPPSAPPPPTRPPAFELAFYDHLLHLDADGRWWFEALWHPDRAAGLSARLDALRGRIACPPRPRAFLTENWSAMPSAAGHGIAVEACRRRIAAGDLFQANLCVRLEAQIVGAPVDLFAVAAAKLKPDRAAFFATPSGAVASLSPELFLRRRGNAVASAPIKGTRPRPRDDRAAAGQRQELATSPKDRAENVMIVDLVRNDLGRVCRPGSVRVRELCQVRPHAGVWHLVSEVVGTVPDETAHSELVRPAFPPGSVTGAPKIAAMNVIAELESTPRQLYTGAIGFASPLAGLELSVAIRTFEFAAQKVWLGVGGGIVADSDGAAEAAECVTKAAPLLAAIGARPPGQARESNAPPIRRLAPRPVPRPDPARGVFETLLVSDGRALRPQLHLARLASSVAELYGAELPVGIASAIQAAAARRKRARLRLDVRPVGRGVATRIQVSGLSARTLPVPLHAVTLPGGLGAHKWADRRLLDALADDLEGREPLLCDIDGRVLEARRASVFLVPGAQRILTPPADGRILPGVTRARVIELASELGYDVRTEPIDLAQLADAREIFVTGSLGGVEPAELDGQPARDRQISEELAHALRPPSVPLSDKLVQALASSDTGTG